jgi:DNA-binding transcriptional LysR family regulator
LVAGIDALKRTFQEKRAGVRPRLTVATTQRTLIEDLPDSILEFEKRYPEVQLCFKEMSTREVVLAVESGKADLGLTVEAQSEPPNPALRFEPAYALEHFLVTPRKHPLAQRQRVRPEDLLAYPLVNAADSIPDPAVTATLEKLGAFRTPPRRIEAYYTAVIRHYVALGFGIGLVVGLPAGRRRSKPPLSPALHERSLSRYFGRTVVNLVQRKGLPEPWFTGAFAELIKERLGSRGADSRKKRP